MKRYILYIVWIVLLFHLSVGSSALRYLKETDNFGLLDFFHRIFLLSEEEKTILLYGAPLIIVTLIYAIALKIKSNSDSSKIKELNDSLVNKNTELSSYKNDLLEQTKNNALLTKDNLLKNKLISGLSQELHVLCDESSEECVVADSLGDDINEKAIVRRFKELAVKEQVPSESQWTLLDKVFEHFLPNFRNALERNKCLTENEYRICMLIKLGFGPKELMILMNKSNTNISNRGRMGIKIFGEKLSSVRFDYYIRKIPGDGTK